MDIDEKVIKAIEETHDTVIELKTVLLGKNSDKGLVGQVEEHEKKINRNTIILVAIIASGALGSGIVGLLNLFK